jgi:uncharacterized protein
MEGTDIHWMLCTRRHNYSELCHVDDDGTGMSISGTVLATEDGTSHELRYEVRTGEGYRTTNVRIARGWPEPVFHLVLERHSDGYWWRNGKPLDGFDDCVDVDLGFTPSTNSLPIRRLNLEVGERREISVVWILFPQFSVVRGEQTYKRIAADRYVYESGDFGATLKVNGRGVVLEYEGLWVAKGLNIRP